MFYLEIACDTDGSSLFLSFSDGKHLQHRTALEKSSKSLCAAMCCSSKYILVYTEQHKYVNILQHVYLHILPFFFLAERTVKILTSSYIRLV